MDIKKIFFPGISVALLLLGSTIYRASAQTPDPGIPGTHTVIKTEYNLGDLAYTPPLAALFPANMEVIGSVHYPADLSSGPFPVIMILHGRHSTCYDSVSMTVASEGWPCTGVNKSIVSYEGYDYLATNMASHGYIVISISANAINAIDGGLPDAGMNARGVLVQHHLDLWNTWNTVGGFPGNPMLFVGALNMQNVGTMGHSRGGEGVIFNAGYNASLGSPYGIKAVLTLAPVDFYRHTLNGTPIMNVAPYCDGDVNDLQGVHFYDDVRYNDTTDFAPKHEVVYMGADHDLFNTVWTPGSPTPGGVDDWTYGYSESAAWCGTASTGSGRLDSTHQKAALLPYFAAFYRVYLGHESQFAPILNVDDTIPPASSLLNSSQVHVSFHPSRINRLDINRTDSTARFSVNTLSGNVTQDSLLSAELCGGGSSLGEGNCITPFTQAKQSHNSNSGTIGLSQMGMQWDTSAAWYQNDLPVVYENLTKYQDIIFRTSVNYTQTHVDSNLNFTVQLIDSLGDTSGQEVASYSNSLFYQPGTQGGDLPKLLFNTVKIPLSSFTGIDMSVVRAVRFVFNKSKKGSVFISDLAFSSLPCSGITAQFIDSIGVPGYHVTYTNTTTANTTDSIAWYWNFGDPASGVNDTSTVKNPPTHTYPASGAYTVCLSVTAYRKNGFICTDTFCTSVVLHAATEIHRVVSGDINIFPNPASDHLNITGAANTDVLTLLDLYGQVVFTATISTSVIYLPHPLATGIYYAVISTNTGEKVYKKLLINQ